MKIIAEFNSVEEIKEFSEAFKGNGITEIQDFKCTVTTNDLSGAKKSEDSEIKRETKTKTKKESKKKEVVKNEEKEVIEETKKVDFTEIREVATSLVQAGKQPELAEITAKYGASKLSELKEEDYEAVLNEFKELM